MLLNFLPWWVPISNRYNGPPYTLYSIVLALLQSLDVLYTTDFPTLSEGSLRQIRLKQQLRKVSRAEIELLRGL